MNEELKDILTDILELIQRLSINDNYDIFVSARELSIKILEMETTKND